MEAARSKPERSEGYGNYPSFISDGYVPRTIRLPRFYDSYAKASDHTTTKTLVVFYNLQIDDFLCGVQVGKASLQVGDTVKWTSQ